MYCSLYLCKQYLDLKTIAKEYSSWLFSFRESSERNHFRLVEENTLVGRRCTMTLISFTTSVVTLIRRYCVRWTPLASIRGMAKKLMIRTLVPAHHVQEREIGEQITHVREKKCLIPMRFDTSPSVLFDVNFNLTNSRPSKLSTPNISSVVNVQGICSYFVMIWTDRKKLKEEHDVFPQGV